jgi:hypothetical protein
MVIRGSGDSAIRALTRRKLGTSSSVLYFKPDHLWLAFLGSIRQITLRVTRVRAQVYNRALKKRSLLAASSFSKLLCTNMQIPINKTL